ncbi:transcriptional attenuator, LytR family [Melghirimyces algeriensis]|uniref:Transcriptional attenuator, LytR family n=2 Tax=Melghirimyces algeriensis TaxID=910412 RepID=A0A521CIQ5_9BACL|nr:transcriptional attenuator, LytR family [Melghirimyces algeriensis]
MLGFFLIVILAICSYWIFQLWYAMDDSFDELNRGIKSNKRDQKITMKDPFTIMFVGTDNRNAKETYWRPDTIMVIAINPDQKTMKILSIPRDTKTEIANTNGWKTKINAAAYYGLKSNVGPITNTVETVENLLNIPIDYYVKVNFNGFIELVDAVGGVDVNVPFDFSMRLFDQMQYYKKGPAHLNGTRALGYVRMRKSDPENDLGRNKRQREVIQSLMNKLTRFQSIAKINDILQSLGKNITHNMEINEMIALQKIYRNIPQDHIETLEIDGVNSNKNPKGIWYYIVSDQERLQLSNIIRKQLELPSQTLDGKSWGTTSLPNSNNPKRQAERTEIQ